jgi:hypothetical protein
MSLEIASIISGDTLFNLSTPRGFDLRQWRTLKRFEEHFRKPCSVIGRESAGLLLKVRQ